MVLCIQRPVRSQVARFFREAAQRAVPSQPAPATPLTLPGIAFTVDSPTALAHRGACALRAGGNRRPPAAPFVPGTVGRFFFTHHHEQRTDCRPRLFRTRKGHQAGNPHRGRFQRAVAGVQESRRPRARPAHRHQPEVGRNPRAGESASPSKKSRTSTAKSLLANARKIKPDAPGRRRRGGRGHPARLRAHQRADRQAGHAPAHPFGGEGDDVRRVQGPRGRDRQRHGAAVRAQRRDRGPGQVRRHHAQQGTRRHRGLQRRRPAARLRHGRGKRRARARDHPFALATPISSAVSSRWRSARSTTAPWKSAAWRARPVTARRSPCIRPTKRSIPSARAWACAAAGSRTSCANSTTRRWTSSAGAPSRAISSSRRWSPRASRA